MGKYALILVLSLFFSIFAYNWGINNTKWTSEVRNTESFNRGQAKNIAQSAAQVTVAKIMSSGDQELNPQAGQTIFFPSANEFLTWNDLQGEYRIQVTNHADTLLVAQTIGRFGGVEYPVEITLALAGSGTMWQPEFPLAVHAGSSIELNGSARIEGTAGTNSIAANSVRINSWAWPNAIDGDLYIGPGGNPSSVITSPNPNSVGGDVKIMATELSYPMPDFPQIPSTTETTGSIQLGGNSSLTLMPEDFSGKFIPEMRIQSNTHLTINTSGQDLNLVVGSLDVQQGHIHIQGGGSVNFYVMDEFNLGGSSRINEHGDVDQAFIFYQGTQPLSLAGNTRLNGGIFAETASISLGGSNGLIGHLITGGSQVSITGNASAHSRVVYAPNATVTLTGSGSVTGAIVASDFVGSGNPRVFFTDEFNSDLPPLDTSGGSGPGEPIILSWN